MCKLIESIFAITYLDGACNGETSRSTKEQKRKKKTSSLGRKNSRGGKTPLSLEKVLNAEKRFAKLREDLQKKNGQCTYDDPAQIE